MTIATLIWCGIIHFFTDSELLVPASEWKEELLTKTLAGRLNVDYLRVDIVLVMISSLLVKFMVAEVPEQISPTNGVTVAVKFWNVVKLESSTRVSFAMNVYTISEPSSSAPTISTLKVTTPAGTHEGLSQTIPSSWLATWRLTGPSIS